MASRTGWWLLLAGALTASAGADPARAFGATSPDAARAWQQESRRQLAAALAMDDLLAASPPLEAMETSRSRWPRYERLEIELRSTPDRVVEPGRRIKAIVTEPLERPAGRMPAVVCIHGHGGNRGIVYDTESQYRGFGHVLAGAGFVTISTEVGQHQVYEPGRTLMGERLWDVRRCVDYLRSRPDVDPERIGCAGLSLGGEMALWLGATDERVAATVSSGFLTTVANLRDGHCPCWDFPGLTESYDFSDIYSLIAPRALMCQNGQLEGHGGFPPAIAEPAWRKIQAAYAVFGALDKTLWDTPDVKHVFYVDPAVEFLQRHLRAN